jgi:hypothetical protein
VLIHEGVLSQVDARDPSLIANVGIANGNKANLGNFHDKDPTQQENYLACDGHVKYIKIPYIASYDLYAPAVPLLSPNNLGSYVLTMSYQ